MQKSITIVGAGLVGSLCALYLTQRGHTVNLFERRMKEETDKVTKGIREKDPDEKLPRLKTVAGRLDIKKAFWLIKVFYQ